jgi:RNA polymerase sigma factor (TIGR02999 family)
MCRHPDLAAGRILDAASSPVTELLHRWSDGDVVAQEQLIPLVYNELRRIAKRCLAAQPHNTLQSTALVHEAYLRLVGNSIRWEDRVHFFALAAQLMRRILVDHSRMKRAQKRGGDSVTLVLDENLAVSAERELDLIALDDALNALAAIDERQARLVELRFFVGLSIEETAHALEVSPATVKREWAKASLWLLQQIRRTPPG